MDKNDIQILENIDSRFEQSYNILRELLDSVQVTVRDLDRIQDSLCHFMLDMEDKYDIAE